MHGLVNFKLSKNTFLVSAAQFVQDGEVNNYFEIKSFFPRGVTSPSGPEPPSYRGFTITLRHTTLGRTPLDEWLARRRDFRPLNDNIQRSQETDIHVPVGIRTHKTSKRAAADPHLKPSCHCYRQNKQYTIHYITLACKKKLFFCGKNQNRWVLLISLCWIQKCILFCLITSG